LGIATAKAAQNVNMETSPVVIDVRTPIEVATGILEGAIDIDWYSPSFASDVSSLDRSAPYVIYCRSGYRSGEAVDAMTGMGFTNVINAGSIEEAAELTGLPIVRR
jgi:rhodanese-related sulfurtransferase